MMWDHIPVEALIEKYVPPYGLAPKRWLAQVEEIRQLPEADKPDEKRAA